jgi:hypothetical protein
MEWEQTFCCSVTVYVYCISNNCYKLFRNPISYTVSSKVNSLISKCKIAFKTHTHTHRCICNYGVYCETWYSESFNSLLATSKHLTLSVPVKLCV